MEEVHKFTAKNGELITLRQAVPEDAREIINTVSSTSLERSYVLMEKHDKNPETEAKYIRDMDRKSNLLLVAIANGAVVGSLAALQSDGGHRQQTAHILNIGLHLTKTYRGLGIGSEMLRYTVKWAVEHRFKKLEASIFTTNKRSLNLFGRAGFVEEATKRKQFRIGTDYIDEVIMAMFLE
ncbi:MAG TPA: GNAT family protein [Thermodesulfovibrionales bacterium]|jgi:RimJ/RimL family protein N-acetyltransferase|nr:GNAT family protein [Thermodesulfovibrionales bacterium]